MVTSWLWTSSGISHQGNERSLNEDAYLDAGSRCLWAVADGMGGHEAGDVASRRVIEALAGIAPGSTVEDYAEGIRGAVARANAALLDLGRARPGGIVGSTVVVLCAAAGRAGVLWAGDSRAYRLRDGRLEQLTRDHSRVQDLVDRGRLDPEQAESHPQANLITRAVGVSDTLELDFKLVDLADDDRFLLCSDGLSRYVGPERMAAALRRLYPRESCSELLEAALAAPARDNVTVVVAGCREDTQAETIFNPEAPRAEEPPEDATIRGEPPGRQESADR